MRQALRRTAVATGLYRPLSALRPWLDRGYRRDLAEHRRLSQLIGDLLSHDSHCVDVGCYAGEMLATMMRCAPDGRFIAYEPVPHLYEDLVRRFPTVDVRQAAASNVNDESVFTVVQNEPGYSGLRVRDYPFAPSLAEIRVRTERLDDHLPERFHPALIKIDVEGAEALVLQGARETLRRCRPAVLFEHQKGAAEHYGSRPADVFELLTAEPGLRIFDLDGNGPYTMAQFQEAFDSGRWINFLARAR